MSIMEHSDAWEFITPVALVKLTTDKPVNITQLVAVMSACVATLKRDPRYVKAMAAIEVALAADSCPAHEPAAES